MDWKKLLIDVLKVVAGALCGFFASGCKIDSVGSIFRIGG